MSGNQDVKKFAGTKDTKKVGEAFQILYNELPKKYEGSSSKHGNGNNHDQLKEFLAESIPKSDQKEIEGELKKTFMLRNTKGRKKIGRSQPLKRRPQGKALTARHRRDLGLFKLPKKGMKFSDYHSLHELWQGYMAELVDWDKFKYDPDLLPGGDESMQTRICRADYHGALFKVTRSKNAGLLGLEGYVLMETKNTLQILDRTDTLKVVPKAGSSFSFAVKGHLITLSGSSMCLKPAERNVKKWKLRLPYDF